MAVGKAWYSGTRDEFLNEELDSIVGKLQGAAASDGWQIPPDQTIEWQNSVKILQDNLNITNKKVQLLKNAIRKLPSGSCNGIILEYDFRRRGLRLDCIILAQGTIFILEFKRSQFQSADNDQIMQYCVNLYEFHEQTRSLVQNQKFNIIPILVMTEEKGQKFQTTRDFFKENWHSILRRPIKCDASSLTRALASGLNLKKKGSQVANLEKWLKSDFSPSSTILDAALSLYGQHDVSAIKEHQVPVKTLKQCIKGIESEIQWALEHKKNHLILISGAPGSGKTLVGLDITFSHIFGGETAFVTGNAPLVKVLQVALQRAYQKMHKNSRTRITGYAKENFKYIDLATTYKIVNAHTFLGERGKKHGSKEGRILIFDEAQRTYEEGKQVLGKALQDHEADLIMIAQQKQYKHSVIVALLGHNQAINLKERGGIAWLEAAEKLKWSFAVSDETMNLSEFSELAYYKTHRDRRVLKTGHLRSSLRYYRNQILEEWAHWLLEGDLNTAKKKADALGRNGTHIYFTRDLNTAKKWVRQQMIGETRGGMIVSAQGKRLSAEGIFVGLKPDIATWMLEPSSDIRSSNMLETAQNQYQIQGLELDFSLICWDADLRWEDNHWAAYKISGNDWGRDSYLNIAKNVYRVLLTRCRKGMVIFIPVGDKSSQDITRKRIFYDGIEDALIQSGVKKLP